VTGSIHYLVALNIALKVLVSIPRLNQQPAIWQLPGTANACAKREIRAIRFGIAQERKHHSMTVHNPSRRREERTNAPHFRLVLRYLLACEEAQCCWTINAIAPRYRRDVLEHRYLGGLCGNDEFPNSLCVHTVILTETIEQLAAFDARSCLERTVRIVDARVDYLGVSGRGSGAKAAGCLEDEDLTASERELSCNRESNDSSTDHTCLHTEGLRCSHGRLRCWATVGPRVKSFFSGGVSAQYNSKHA
jgi:hypothetical protein